MPAQNRHKSSKLPRCAATGFALTWMASTVLAQSSLQTVEITAMQADGKPLLLGTTSAGSVVDFALTRIDPQR